jgi:hypothetical protein
VFTNLGGGFDDHSAGIFGEFIGIWWGNGGQTSKVTWSTETIAGADNTGASHGQQKGLSGKAGYGYGGDQGNYNGGYNFRKTNMTTTSSSDSGARPAKMFGNMGEENYGTGQLKGYVAGTYDGAQNNRGGQITYSTDSASENNALYLTSRHGGSSSGCMFGRD